MSTAGNGLSTDHLWLWRTRAVSVRLCSAGQWPARGFLLMYLQMRSGEPEHEDLRHLSQHVWIVVGVSVEGVLRGPHRRAAERGSQTTR
jgi:hypothetical protein